MNWSKTYHGSKLYDFKRVQYASTKINTKTNYYVAKLFRHSSKNLIGWSIGAVISLDIGRVNEWIRIMAIAFHSFLRKYLHKSLSHSVSFSFARFNSSNTFFVFVTRFFSIPIFHNATSILRCLHWLILLHKIFFDMLHSMLHLKIQ